MKNLLQDFAATYLLPFLFGCLFFVAPIFTLSATICFFLIYLLCFHLMINGLVPAKELRLQAFTTAEKIIASIQAVALLIFSFVLNPHIAIGVGIYFLFFFFSFLIGMYFKAKYPSFFGKIQK
jgi:hypothetical protein